MPRSRSLGRSTPRVDGRERVSGAANFTADIQLPGMLYAAALRSPYAHARVTSIDCRAAAGRRQASVRSSRRENAGDFNEPNRGMAIFGDELLFAGMEVALVVAETRAQARMPSRAIRVKYSPLPFVVDPIAALAPDATSVSTTLHDNSISDDLPKTYERGDVDQGLADADVTRRRDV